MNERIIDILIYRLSFRQSKIELNKLSTLLRHRITETPHGKGNRAMHRPKNISFGLSLNLLYFDQAAMAYA